MTDEMAVSIDHLFMEDDEAWALRNRAETKQSLPVTNAPPAVSNRRSNRRCLFELWCSKGRLVFFPMHKRPFRKTVCGLELKQRLNQEDMYSTKEWLLLLIEFSNSSFSNVFVFVQIVFVPDEATAQKSKEAANVVGGESML